MAIYSLKFYAWIMNDTEVYFQAEQLKTILDDPFLPIGSMFYGSDTVLSETGKGIGTYKEDFSIPLDESVPPDELIQGHDPNHPITTPTDTPNEFDYIISLLYPDTSQLQTTPSSEYNYIN